MAGILLNGRNYSGGGSSGGTVDEALSPSSTNAVQNKAIYNAIAMNLYGGTESLEVYNELAKNDYSAGDTLCYIDADDTLKVAKVKADISEGDYFEYSIENLNLINNIPNLLGVTHTTPEDIVVNGQGSPRYYYTGDKILVLNPPDEIYLATVIDDIRIGDTIENYENIKQLPSLSHSVFGTYYQYTDFALTITTSQTKPSGYKTLSDFPAGRTRAYPIELSGSVHLTIDGVPQLFATPIGSTVVIPKSVCSDFTDDITIHFWFGSDGNDVTKMALFFEADSNVSSQDTINVCGYFTVKS